MTKLLEEAYRIINNVYQEQYRPKMIALAVKNSKIMTEKQFDQSLNDI